MSFGGGWMRVLFVVLMISLLFSLGVSQMVSDQEANITMNKTEVVAVNTTAITPQQTTNVTTQTTNATTPRNIINATTQQEEVKPKPIAVIALCSRIEKEVIALTRDYSVNPSDDLLEKIKEKRKEFERCRKSAALEMRERIQSRKVEAIQRPRMTPEWMPPSASVTSEKTNPCDPAKRQVLELRRLYESKCTQEATSTTSQCEDIMKKVEEAKGKLEECYDRYGLYKGEKEEEEKVSLPEWEKKRLMKMSEEECQVLFEKNKDLRARFTSMCTSSGAKYTDECAKMEREISLNNLRMRVCGKGLEKKAEPGFEACPDDLEAIKDAVVEAYTNAHEIGDKDMEEKLKGSVMSLQRACKANPCLKLERMKYVYSVVLKANASSTALNRIEDRIDELEGLCQESEANVSSLQELDAVMSYKAEKAVEGTKEEELQSELEKIREERRRLIREFARRMKELDLREQNLLRKLRIQKGKIVTDEGDELPPVDVKVDVGGKETKISPGQDSVYIEDSGIKVKAGEVVFDKGLVKTSTGKLILVPPSAAIQKVATSNSKLEDVELVEKETPRYRARMIEKRALLGIIPVDVPVESEIDATTGQVTRANRPFWAFLAF